MTSYDWALGVQDQGGQSCGRAISGLAKSRILDGRDHGGQEQGHVHLFCVAFII